MIYEDYDLRGKACFFNTIIYVHLMQEYVWKNQTTKKGGVTQAQLRKVSQRPDSQTVQDDKKAPGIHLLIGSSCIRELYSTLPFPRN